MPWLGFENHLRIFVAGCLAVIWGGFRLQPPSHNTFLCLGWALKTLNITAEETSWLLYEWISDSTHIFEWALESRITMAESIAFPGSEDGSQSHTFWLVEAFNSIYPSSRQIVGRRFQFNHTLWLDRNTAKIRYHYAGSWITDHDTFLIGEAAAGILICWNRSLPYSIYILGFN